MSEVVSTGTGYYRKSTHGPAPRRLAEVAAAIISRSVSDGNCLIFTGSVLPNGYGQVLARGLSPAPLYVHRVIFAHHNGWFPVRAVDGQEVSHLCGRKACVNPAHLVAESHAANMARIPRNRGGRPTLFDTEAVAAEIERDGIWPVIVRHRMSYQHALRIRAGWRPQKPYRPSPAVATSDARELCLEGAAS
jgi:hypothetical protein